MSDVFVRVSIFHGQRQLDVSLPYTRPVVDIVDDVVDLLSRYSEPVGEAAGDAHNAIGTADTHTWVLSSPKTGVIDPHTTLAEHGIEDGGKLYLTRRQEAARSPFVDDAIAEVRTTIASAQWGWSGAIRSSGSLGVLTALLIAVAAALTLNLVRAPSPLPGSAWVHIGILVAVALTAFCLSLWRKHDWMRWLGWMVPYAVGVLAYVFLGQMPAGAAVPLGAAAVAIGAVSAVLAAGLTVPAGGVGGTVAALIIAVCCAAAGVGVLLGGNIYGITAWSAWLPVLMLTMAPSIGLRATGLPTLIRQNDAGNQVERDAIKAYARRAEATSRGVSWAAALLALGSLVSLTASPVWQHGLIALLISAVLLLRQNGYADGRIIVVLATTGLLGLAMLAGATVRWGQNGWAPLEAPTPWWLPGSGNQWVWLTASIILALASLTMTWVHQHTRDDVQEARFARFISVVDVTVCLASIPLILAAQGLYQFFWATT